MINRQEPTDATPCPVCKQPLNAEWHLLCPACWHQVATSDQDELIRLHKQKPGSQQHRQKCYAIVRSLLRDKRHVDRNA